MISLFVRNLNLYKIYKFLLLAIAILIPFIEYFKTKFASIALILLFICWIASLDFENKFERLLANKIIFLFLLLYLINLYGLLLPIDNHVSEKVLIKKASLLIFPLIIGTGPVLDYKFVKRILFFFVVSLVLGTFITLSGGVEKLILSPAGLEDLAGKITIHRPYFGLFCAFSIIGLLHFIDRNHTIFGLTLYTIVSIYLLFFILFIYAKMALLALFITAIVLLFIWFLKTKKYIYFTILSFASIVSIAALYQFVPAVKNFINNIKAGKDFSYADHNILIVGSINVRYINWGCAVDILKENNNWITGVGAGNAQSKLQDCYKYLNPWIYENKMNAHNQFLEETLYNGILGLCIFLACILIPAFIAYKQNNFLYLGFILIFATCSLAESVLNRSVGIIFYAFFNSILFFNPKKSLA